MPAFIALVVGFGFVIFVHELGHFVVAKWVGIKVEQFAVGFGHAMLSWRRGLGVRIGSTQREYHKRIIDYVQSKDGASQAPTGAAEDDAQPELSSATIAAASQALGLSETEYRLNWVPLGGYVKMLGQEDMNPTAQSDDPRAFNRKPVWARACVISAGVIMNLIFAVIFFVACFLYGVEFPPAVAGQVITSRPAAQAYAQGHENDPNYYGLEVGDRITAIDGKPVSDFMELAVEAALSKKAQVLELTVEREGEKEPLTFRLEPKKDRKTEMLSLGIGQPVTTIIELLPIEGPYAYLHQQGVEPGMQVTAVDGEPVSSYGGYHRAIAARRGADAKVTFTDPADGTSVTVDVVARGQLSQSADGSAHLIGLVPAVHIVEVQEESPAQKAGIRARDYLTLIGTQRWPSTSQVYDIVQQAQGRKLALAVLRDGKVIALPQTAPDRKNMLGIGMISDQAIVGQTVPGSPAAALDLVGGSRITSINGQPVKTWSDVQQQLQLATIDPGKQAAVTIGYTLAIAEPTDELKTVTLNQDDIRQLAQARWGPQLPDLLFAPMLRTVKTDNPVAAAQLGIEKTHQFMLHTYLTLTRLFQGTVPVKELRGPIGIAHIGTKVAKQGWSYLLFFLGLISVNLAVINFLPIPITDGGLMLFLVVEKIKGSPVSPRIQTAAFFVGLALIGSVFLITLFYDTTRLFGGG